MARIPRTGSTTILRGIFGTRRWRAVAQGRFPEEWQGYYSFAFVRNPYDRLVSAFRMFQSYPVYDQAEREFQCGLSVHAVMDLVENPDIAVEADGYLSRLKRHAIPMTSSYFCLEHMREVYRFERFEDELRRLSRTIDFPFPTPLPHLRNRGAESRGDLLTADERERAGRVFRGDFERFGYALSGRRGEVCGACTITTFGREPAAEAQAELTEKRDRLPPITARRYCEHQPPLKLEAVAADLNPEAARYERRQG